MRKVLSPAFFDRSMLTVARELLGKYLVHKIGKKEIALMIMETEAYGGLNDLASHSRSGMTARNAPMFDRAGTIYVYFTYGIHWMLNVVCGKAGHPAAVLIRALSPLQTQVCKDVVLNGPAKLTKFLKIDKKLNGTMLGKAAGLWIEDRGVRINPKDIKKTPRIGVNYAGAYKSKLRRFVLMPRVCARGLRDGLAQHR